MVSIYGEQAHHFECTAARIEQALALFAPISLAEMDGVALLDRTDTKYVMSISQLYGALRQMVGQYRVLEVNHRRLNHYQTLYFDTHDFALFRSHHNGLHTRYKVRFREYVDSDLTFLEVKRKSKTNRTVKCRMQTPNIVTTLDEPTGAFVQAHAPFDPRQLEPKLWNEFLRITLVGIHHAERLTLDLNLQFAWGDAVIALPGVAIAEVKQDGFSRHSPFVRHMRRIGLRPGRFSKYCTGVCMLYDHVKTNNFKPQLRLVTHLMQEEEAYGLLY